jgi:GTP-binding protein
MFIDEVEICVRAGDGGNGCASLHHEKFRPLGGPDGGDGGRGGSVILRASDSVNTLVEYTRKRHFRAARGGSGAGNNRHGAEGRDLVLQVPVGTQARDEDGTLIADLPTPGREAIVARGGGGGRGNAAFVTPARRTPDFAERGEKGEERWIRLELKLLADVGVVGYPNVGKSTLISRISAARPRVADYPFTTLEPVLGVVRVGEEDSFVVSDLPGLIEGAHEGRGLGLRFLRHVERTVVLLHMLDVSGDAETGPARALEVIADELASYSLRLLERPQVVAGNKLDAADPERLREAGDAAAYRGWEFFPISAVTGEGVQDLIWRLAEMVDETRCEESPEMPEERTVYTFDPERERGFRVVREEEAFRVYGDRVESLLSRLDLDNPQALAYVQHRLKRMGVEDELAKQGAREGDTVIIADHIFDFLPEEGPGLED